MRRRPGFALQDKPGGGDQAAATIGLGAEQPRVQRPTPLRAGQNRDGGGDTAVAQVAVGRKVAGRDAPDYHDVVAATAIRGDGGCAVIGLMWLIALNACAILSLYTAEWKSSRPYPHRFR